MIQGGLVNLHLTRPQLVMFEKGESLNKYDTEQQFESLF